ncbi:transposase zinc-binding domain-containing protein [Clostridium estertheticum]|nr:transposase zinc-binding domain-containing protein [Clostridium estertheticum]
MGEHMNIEVMKMIECGGIALDFVACICLKCLDVFKVEFTCKSRFCSKCGEKHINVKLRMERARGSVRHIGRYLMYINHKYFKMVRL